MAYKTLQFHQNWFWKIILWSYAKWCWNVFNPTNKRLIPCLCTLGSNLVSTKIKIFLSPLLAKWKLLVNEKKPKNILIFGQILGCVSGWELFSTFSFAELRCLVSLCLPRCHRLPVFISSLSSWYFDIEYK